MLSGICGRGVDDTGSCGDTILVRETDATAVRSRTDVPGGRPSHYDRSTPFSTSGVPSIVTVLPGRKPVMLPLLWLVPPAQTLLPKPSETMPPGMQAESLLPSGTLRLVLTP